MANQRSEELTDEQWELLGALIPEPVRRADGRGRPWRENREVLNGVLNGVLWILRSGARWQDLPERFPPYQTCRRAIEDISSGCALGCCAMCSKPLPKTCKSAASWI